MHANVCGGGGLGGVPPQYTDEENTAVCNLASLVLTGFVGSDGTIDYELLARAVRRVVRNLNNVIDRNFYPTDEARRSNMRVRPVGIGMQGFQDVLFKLEMPFDSDEARKLNREVRTCARGNSSDATKAGLRHPPRVTRAVCVVCLNAPEKVRFKP